MLTGKRAPLYISLCLIVCMVGMAFFTILVQSRAQSGALWAERAADLYADSLDIGHGLEDRAQRRMTARSAMLSALRYDPYNAAHWMRYSVIDSQGVRLEPTLDIIGRLKPDEGRQSQDFILPSAPPRPRRELD